MKTAIWQKGNPQRGVSLILVLIVLLLTLTALLAAFRVSIVNEALVGNSSDYSRAQAAAEALIRDAEIDIRGRRPPYNTVQTDGQVGWPCRPNPPTDTRSNYEIDGYESSCRLRNSTTAPWFPQSNEEFDDVSDIITSTNSASRCLDAICIPMSLNSYAAIKNKPNEWAQFGATYGQFTRNELSDLGVAGNPILSSFVPRAWYWIEAFRYSDEIAIDADVVSKLVPSNDRNFVYRITAVALGMRPGTKVVMRSVFVPYPKNQGQ